MIAHCGPIRDHGVPAMELLARQMVVDDDATGGNSS